MGSNMRKHHKMMLLKAAWPQYFKDFLQIYFQEDSRLLKQIGELNVRNFEFLSPETKLEIFNKLEEFFILEHMINFDIENVKHI